MRLLSHEQVRLVRLRSQRLHPEAAEAITGVGQLVREVFALQAQELPAAALGVRARSRGLTLQDVQRAREIERSMVLTWCMRGTMHLVPAEDLAWLVAFLGPIFIQKGERRYAQLRLTPPVRERATRLIRGLLSSRGALTRPELAEALAAQGIPVEGQAIAHLVGYAALQGVICFGPEREGKPTFVLLEDWVKPERTLEAERAAADLAHRYLEAYGPAAPEDLASWSGISTRQARAGFQAISGELAEVRLGDAPAWMLKSRSAWLDEAPGDPVVRLLPRYDAYLLGYQSRAFMASAEAEQRIHPGGGQIHAILVIDGRAAGTWRVEPRRNTHNVHVEPFETLKAGIHPALEAEAQDIGRFLGREARLSLDTALDSF